MKLSDIVSSNGGKLIASEVQTEIVNLNLPIHATNKLISLFGVCLMLYERECMDKATVIMNLIGFYKEASTNKPRNEEAISVILTILGAMLGFDDPTKVKTKVFEDMGLPITNKGIRKNNDALFLLHAINAMEDQNTVLEASIHARLERLFQEYPNIDPTIPKPSMN